MANDITNIAALGFYFFLGGKDAEMVTIRQAAGEIGVPFEDAGLGWGAKASAYGTRIAEVAEAGYTPVLVELEVDCDLPQGAVVVDHHGSRSSEPASILQVLSLLGRDPTRWETLIAANDSGFIPGLEAADATPEEIAAVRAADRSAQGITPEQEAEGERSLAEPAEYIGGCRIIHLAHSKCATVTDRLYRSGVRESILILSGDGEVNFYGDGRIIATLNKKFPGGEAPWGGPWTAWSGGSLPIQGFWGGYPSHEEVVATLRELVA